VGSVAPMTGRLGITDVRPTVSCGEYPASAVVGETLRVTATVFREGHDAVAASIALTPPDGGPTRRTRMRRLPPEAGVDAWGGSVMVDAEGCWTFTVEAWSDPVETWRHGIEVKIAAGVDVGLELEEGARLMERCRDVVPERDRDRLTAVAAALRDSGLDVHARVAPALAPDVHELLDVHPLRELVTPSAERQVWVDRRRALFGSWYEFFPRSEGAVVDPTGAEPPRSGTFRTSMERLPAIAAAGFDVVYLPPIHPIGKVNRKGPNSAKFPGGNPDEIGPYDVGSPWAIGSDEGGHDAVHPDLGTLEDFDAFVAAAHQAGMEVALDLALQAAPDHPWAGEHPEWFTIRADGTIAYAENPPKKYQDIYPINFDKDPEGIYNEVLRVVRHWMSHGVRIFRVDNPHTKPLNFWQWLIAEVKKTDPDVLFLAEAFTKPPMMHELAKLGFTQSYTYFTWRTAKGELEEYARELAETTADFMIPNFFVNTPDILHASLQYGGPPMFKIRAVLAALLSPTWGVYSGYELYEHTAVRPGSEEYLDSEKYVLRPRDYARAEAEGRSLMPYLRRLNQFRREHPAAQWLKNLVFHSADNDQIMVWSKTTSRSVPGAPPADISDADTVLVVVNLDSYNTREATVKIDMPALGFGYHDRYRVTDALTGESWEWGEYNYVRLDPFAEPAHLFVVTPA
jgi:starch synthase (maltosyl-transferring)